MRSACDIDMSKAESYFVHFVLFDVIKVTCIDF